MECHAYMVTTMLGLVEHTRDAVVWFFSTVKMVWCIAAHALASLVQATATTSWQHWSRQLQADRRSPRQRSCSTDFHADLGVKIVLA